MEIAGLVQLQLSPGNKAREEASARVGFDANLGRFN